jgi:hypothetical protein
MRQSLLACIVSMTFFVGGCNDKTVPLRPSSPPVLTPSPLRPFSFAETFTQIELGEVVHRLVAADSPECVELPGWKCQYFRVTVPNSGMLMVDMTFSLGGVTTQGLDLSLADSQGSKSWHPVVAPVKTGTTYEITLWYVTPGVQFEFRTSLR